MMVAASTDVAVAPFRRHHDALVGASVLLYTSAADSASRLVPTIKRRKPDGAMDAASAGAARGAGTRVCTSAVSVGCGSTSSAVAPQPLTFCAACRLNAGSALYSAPLSETSTRYEPGSSVTVGGTGPHTTCVDETNCTGSGRTRLRRHASVGVGLKLAPPMVR